MLSAAGWEECVISFKAKTWLCVGILGFVLFVALGALLVRTTSHPFWVFGGMLVALGVLYVSAKRLLNSRYEPVIRRVRNQLLFAACCMVSIPVVLVTTELIPNSHMVLFYLEACLAVAAFCLYSVGGWVLIIHGLGLILAVGRRLSIWRRLCLYSAVFVVPVCITAWFVSAPTITERAVLVGVVLIAVFVLTYVDFRRYATEKQRSRYDPVARVVADFLSGRA